MEVDYEHCERFSFDDDDDDWKIELQNIVNFIIVTQATPKNSTGVEKAENPCGHSIDFALKPSKHH